MKSLKILVPTDFSAMSLKAFATASGLAEICNGTITPMHAYEQGKTDHDQVEVFNRREKLNELARRHVRKEFLTDGAVVTERSFRAIVETAENFDLIVMSSHGRAGVTRLMLGSVAEKVVRMSKPPVLVVKEDADINPLESILVTTDFSDNARNAYPLAVSLAKQSGARIHMIYVVNYEFTEVISQIENFKRTKEKQMKQEIEKYFAPVKDRVTFNIPITRKSAHEYLISDAKEQEFDLIVMATLGRTGLDYLRMGSTTSNVIRSVRSNVLITNPDTPVDWE